MWNIELLKKEQAETKQKLVDIIKYINGEEYYMLTQSEKTLIGQRRLALEMYLNSLTKSVYNMDDTVADYASSLWLFLMPSLFSSSNSWGTSSSYDSLKTTFSETVSEVGNGTLK